MRSRLLAEIEPAPLPETEKRALVAARRGQGRFREEVLRIEPRCRVTGVDNKALLTASHIKPWARCLTNEERLDPFNGLMLTPTIDRLFDRGYVTFTNSGEVQISERITVQDASAVGVTPALSVGAFDPRQCAYLNYHREHVFY